MSSNTLGSSAGSAHRIVVAPQGDPEGHRSLTAVDSEVCVIATLCWGEGEWLSTLRQIITIPALFHHERCRAAWEELLSMQAAGLPIIMQAVGARLALRYPDGDRWLWSLGADVPTLSVVRWHAEQIVKAAQCRATIEVLERSRNDLLSGELTAAELADYFKDCARRLEVAIPGGVGGFGESLLTADELAELEILPRQRLLGQWLCQADLGYIFAPRGVGKTWMAMAIPAALSKGTALGAWTPGERSVRVLYVDGEMPLELTRRRAQGLGISGQDVAFLHHETLFRKLGRGINIADPTHQAILTNLLKQNNFGCLLLDNLSCLAVGVDENKGNDYDGINQWLLELRRANITVIIIHHAGRNHQMRGHSKREDACSWILELQDAKAEGEQGARFVSHFAKPSRNTGETQPDLHWHFTTDPTTHQVTIHCEEARVSEYETFIQHVLEGCDTQLNIAELMKKPTGTICKWATRAAKEGRILKREGKLLPPLSTDDE